MQTLLETLNSQSVRSGDKEDELEEHASSYRSQWKRGYVLFRLNSNQRVSSSDQLDSLVAVTHRPFTMVKGLFTSGNTQIVCDRHFPK